METKEKAIRQDGSKYRNMMEHYKCNTFSPETSKNRHLFYNDTVTVEFSETQQSFNVNRGDYPGNTNTYRTVCRNIPADQANNLIDNFWKQHRTATIQLVQSEFSVYQKRIRE